MNTRFLESVVVTSLLVAMPGATQSAVAQGSREPTVDDRYRDDRGNPAEAELPRLYAPQSNATRDKSAPGKNLDAAYLGVNFARGERAAVVQTVGAGSPAEQAGLQPNDLIETLQGRRVRSSQDVFDILARMRPGDVLDIEYSRRMNIRTQAPLASAPASTPHSVGYSPDLPPSTFAAPEDPTMQPNRNSASQDRNDRSMGPRRSDSQRSNQPGENRRFLDRLLRRR
jgi:membrane-associated protease RseP (regulator of RpoE activity)